MKIFHSYKLSRQEIGELRALNTLIKQEQLKLALVKGNTALVHRGQHWARTQEEMIALLVQKQEQLIFASAERLGIATGTPVSVDLQSGIMNKHDSPKIASENN